MYESIRVNIASNLTLYPYIIFILREFHNYGNNGCEWEFIRRS